MSSFRASRGRNAYVIGDDSAGFKEIIFHRIQLNLTKVIADESRKIDALPAAADGFYKKDESHNVRGCTPKLALLLQGIWRDDETEDSPLCMLRGHESTILHQIYEFVSKNELAKHVKLTIPAALAGNVDDRFLLNFTGGRERGDSSTFIMPYILEANPRSNGFQNGSIAFSKCGQTEFPKPIGIMVTMMPFILGDKASLPKDLQPYFRLIQQCPFMKEEIGNVGYLTVHESSVSAGETQRRPGMHTTPPNFFRNHNNAAAFTPGVEHPWGLGVFFGPDRYEGGIYCASNVDGAISVWDALIEKDVRGVVGSTGSCDHFRDIVGPTTKLRAGELIWMTDCTPLAELPVVDPACERRQFFSVVMPYIRCWYEGRWTPNPKVKLPADVTVVRDDKAKASINSGNFMDPICGASASK